MTGIQVICWKLTCDGPLYIGITLLFNNPSLVFIFSYLLFSFHHFIITCFVKEFAELLHQSSTVMKIWCSPSSRNLPQAVWLFSIALSFFIAIFLGLVNNTDKSKLKEDERRPQYSQSLSLRKTFTLSINLLSLMNLPWFLEKKDGDTVVPWYSMYISQSSSLYLDLRLTETAIKKKERIKNLLGRMEDLGTNKFRQTDNKEKQKRNFNHISKHHCLLYLFEKGCFLILIIDNRSF